MKLFLGLTTLFLITFDAFASVKVIYGKDNRQDLYQANNALHKVLAQSTAGMVHAGHFIRSAKEGYFDLQEVPTLEAGQNVCANEAYAQQLTAATCSGFLVGPRTLVTAGHCYTSFDTAENVCKKFAWVFDYDMKSAKHDPTRGIPMSNIYLCKKVVAAQLNSQTDFAVIQLDRPVTGRAPLKIRTAGKLSDSASLVVIGHPSGLPTKIAGDGKITRNSDLNTFATTLDTFHGNSGSAVFDATTGVVEGILIQGKTDYVPSLKSNPNSCKVLNKCDDFGAKCTYGMENGPVKFGEVVLRIETIASIIAQANKLK